MTTADEPWLARRDWRAKRIKDGFVITASALWTFAIAWNLIVITFSLQSIKSPDHPDRALVWFISVFTAAGAFLLILAVYLTAGLLRYGRSVFELDTLPASPGGILAGTIRLRRPFAFREPIRVRLSCHRSTNSGNGSSDTLEWEDNYALDRLAPGQTISEIPVHFKIPDEGRIRELATFNTFITWRLDATAKTHGIHYQATFRVPVFLAPVSREILSMPDATQALRSPEPTIWNPSNRHIRIFPLAGGGGMQYEFSPRTSAKLWVFMLIMGSLFIVGAVGATLAGVPTLIGVGIASLGALISFFGLRMMLTTVTITVRHGMLTLTRATLITKRETQFAAVSVTDITTKLQGNFGNSEYYAIRLIGPMSSGKTLCGCIFDKKDAQTIAADIKRRLGI